MFDVYFFTSLLLLYFGEVKKFKFILKSMSAVSMQTFSLNVLGSTRVYGSGLLPPVYNRPNECFIRFYLCSTFTEKSIFFLILFLHFTVRLTILVKILT